MQAPGLRADPPQNDAALAIAKASLPRAAALGARCSLEGLSKVSRDATGTIYELCLGS